MPTRTSITRSRPSTQSFEEKTTASLDAQDKILETQNDILGRLELKLEAPVLNGGFEDLVKKVERVDRVTEALRETQAASGTKIVDIHSAIYDPEKGIYVTVKDHGRWIGLASSAVKWLIALLITAALGGMGKLFYDFITGHIHYSP